METIFIAGAHGMLGSYVLDLLKDGEYKVIAPKEKHFNINNPDHWRIQMTHHKPKIIINLAAITDVDWCEANPVEAFLTNAIGPALMAEYAHPGSSVIHMSASNVFGESGRGFPEEYDEKFKPLSHYSTSKLIGEQSLIHLLRASKKFRRLVVVRSGWIYGGGEHDKKFVGKIFNKLKNNEEVKAVNDIKGQPVYALNLAKFILRIISSINHLPVFSKNAGIDDTYIFHYAPKDEASRFQMVSKIAKLIGSKSDLYMASNNDFKQKATRPEREFIGVNYNNFIKEFSWKDDISEYYEKELSKLNH
jgi:dTDP-4-dehydrorhamnose reductase